MIDVAISIVSHADRELVRRCLETVPEACRGLRWTVTVVENLPDDGPPLGEGFPWVEVIANASPTGFGENHNRALGKVVSERLARYVLVLNDDTALDPGCITALVHHADAHPTLGAVSPRLTWGDGRHQHSLYSFPRIGRAVVAAVRPRVTMCVPLEQGRGWLRGACLLLRTDALREAGLFDTRFYMFFEDTDLAHRLWDAGWRVEVCDSGTAVHFGEQTTSQPDIAFQMQCQLVRSLYLYFRKDGGRPAGVVVLAAGRTAMWSRAILNYAVAWARRDKAARDAATVLIGLARYSPTRPLPHELRDRAARASFESS